MGNIDDRIAELHLELPDPPRPLGSYLTLVRTGPLAYTSGHGPIRIDGSLVTGRVGLEVSTEEAREAARLTGLGLLATLREHLDSLDSVASVIKVLGMVNCDPDFTDHPAVINGCSDLLVEVFGESGRHARSAVGVGSLPMNIPVEIELIIQLQTP